MIGYFKATSKLLAIVFIFGSALPAHADTYKDDNLSELFEYFNNEKQRSRDGIVLEQTKNRKRGTSATLSLFGRSADPLPDTFSRSNYRSRDWTKEGPTTILNFRLKF